MGLRELIDKLDELADSKNPYSVVQDIELIKSIFYQKINMKEQDSTLDSTQKQENIFKKSLNKYKKNKSEFRKKLNAEEKENLKIKENIITDIKNLTKEIESSRKTFDKFKKLQEEWRKTGYVPIKEKSNIWQSYHHNVEKFYDYLKLNKDLRDIDFSKNYEAKESICNRAEALVNEKSFNKIHDTLQELHEHWKNIGPVKKENRELIWERFQNISKLLNRKRNDYFIEKKKREKERFLIKNKICQDINKLLSNKIENHTEWEEISKKCMELQEEWKKIGKLNNKDNKIAWNKFQETLNTFYSNKKNYYKDKKIENRKKIEKMKNICTQAEKLQNSTEWKKTSNKLIALQKEWKQLGYSKKSDKIWGNFNIACDIFFKRKKENIKKLELEKTNNFKKKTSLLSEIKKISLSEDKTENIKILETFIQKWNNIRHIKQDNHSLHHEFLSIINKKYTKTGLNKQEIEIEIYKTKIKTIGSNKEILKNEKRKLDHEVELIKNKINQYENNISFLSKNKKTEPLLKQVKKKINIENKNILIIKEKYLILNKG